MCDNIAFFNISITFTPARPWYRFTRRKLFASVLCQRNSSSSSSRCCIRWIIKKHVQDNTRWK